ncbi:hypothetical protein GCM10027074_44020 [Streptomyces deserti]
MLSSGPISPFNAGARRASGKRGYRCEGAASYACRGTFPGPGRNLAPATGETDGPKPMSLTLAGACQGHTCHDRGGPGERGPAGNTISVIGLLNPASQHVCVIAEH